MPDPAALHRPLDPIEAAWLTCVREMAAAGRAAAAPLLGSAAGRAILGRGAGGDNTVELDRAAEEAILDVLACRAPAPYAVVSEEIGLGSGVAAAVSPVEIAGTQGVRGASL